MRPTPARVQTLLHYNPRTGIFTWRIQRGCRLAGSRAGSMRREWRVINIDGKSYPASSLAIVWMQKRWPQNIVDHRNNIHNDDRWSNLREATRRQNSYNCRVRGGKHSSLKGVSWHKLAGKYQAQIKVNYRQIYLGLFSTERAAHLAYRAAACKHYGEFARNH
jgi:hypothetical protein